MIGAGGAIPPPDGYWPAVERICRERDVLLIADEVISGFGRLGTLVRLRALRLHARPDDVREGASPRATSRSARWSSRARCARRSGTKSAPPFLQGGHLLGPSRRLRRRAREPRHHRARGTRRARRRARARAARICSHRCRDIDGVADVRSVGLAAAVELDASLLAESPGAAAAAVLAARRHGVRHPCAARRRAPDLAAVRRHRRRARNDRGRRGRGGAWGDCDGSRVTRRLARAGLR